MSAAYGTPAAALGLLGYPADAPRALRELGLVALPLPDGGDLPATIQACQTLQFSGLLVHPSREEAALTACEPDAEARRAGRVDAVSLLSGGLGHVAQGTYTFTEALGDAVRGTGYLARGAAALVIGQGSDLTAAVPLTRLGFSQVGFAAEQPAYAQRLSRAVPAGVASYGLARTDPALATLAERADLIVVTGGVLPAGLLQPYHTLLDLTGRFQGQGARSGATVLDLTGLPALRLSRQLLHVTGQQLLPSELSAVAARLM